MKLLKFAILLPIFLAVLPTNARAQQWSSDPVIDALKQSMADQIKDQEVIDYCRQDANRQKDMCNGVNDHQKSVFLPYDQALKLGQQQLAQEKAANGQPPEQLSLAEYALREKLQGQVEEAVNTYCSKHSDPKSQSVCKDKPTLVHGVMLRLEKKASLEKKKGGGAAN